MNFYEERERLLHPQVRLIPSIIWSAYFYNEGGIFAFDLGLMRMPFDEIKVHLETHRVHTKDYELKIRAWFAIAFGHKDADEAKLLEIAALLNIPPVLLFLTASLTNQPALLDKILALQPVDAQAMVAAFDYSSFRGAAAGGYLNIIEKHIALSPDSIREMIVSYGYEAFRRAAENGHLDVLNKIMTLAPDNVQSMVVQSNYVAFCKAAENGHRAVVNRLLSFSSVFAYAERHVFEYGIEYIRPFMLQKLNELRSRRDAILRENPNAIFDIEDVEEAQLCFYIMRHLVRRNRRDLDDELRFLLDIPAVKTLAPRALDIYHPNELVQLALTTGNQVAAQILLTIPAVRELAEQHDFYRQEVQGHFDLGQLAHDPESSMHALTSGEQKRLAAAFTAYKPILSSIGVPKLMGDLRQELRARYAQNPPVIRRDDQSTLQLPCDYAAFNALILSESEKKSALEAYYQHKDHTALRYLSKPNHWMAKDALYVRVNTETPWRWSTFEEYQPLIILCWLAAKDIAIHPVDGHTLPGRLDHYIDELAHIGRAHNWDKTRTKRMADGKLKIEEYDDLAGDKPSCFSGVKRRLFQSVVGHPLLKFLTLNDIKQELRDFVRDHFKHTINPQNRNTLKQAFDNCIASLEVADATPLKTLDLPPMTQQSFVAMLNQKYGEQFNDDPKLKNYVEKAFTLQVNNGYLDDYAHALRFAHFGLESFLDAPITQANASAFFSPPAVLAAVGKGEGEHISKKQRT